jgi:hypothetical protein
MACSAAPRPALLQSAEVALLHGIVRCAGCRFLMSRALNTSGGYRRIITAAACTR